MTNKLQTAPAIDAVFELGAAAGQVRSAIAHARDMLKPYAGREADHLRMRLDDLGSGADLYFNASARAFFAVDRYCREREQPQILSCGQAAGEEGGHAA